MIKKVIIQKVDPLLTERGIKVGDKLEVLSEGPSDQRKGQTVYRIQGPVGTSIVMYGDEVKIISE